MLARLLHLPRSNHFSQLPRSQVDICINLSHQVSQTQIAAAYRLSADWSSLLFDDCDWWHDHTQPMSTFSSATSQQLL